jgi:hypothetical protein
MASGKADRAAAEKARMLARRKAVVAAEAEAKAAEKITKMSAKDLANQEAINRAKQLGAEQNALSLSYTEQLQALKRQEMIDSGEHVKATKKLLDMKQKQITQQATIDAKFGKFKDTWDDFFSTATDPKIATGLFGVAVLSEAEALAGSLNDAQKSMGISYTQGMKMAGSLSSAAGSGLLLGISVEETLAASGALAETMGDLNEVTSTAIKTVARLGKKYGIAGNEAAGLYKQIKLMSGGTDEMAEKQLQYTENLARANGVAPGKVVGDMAKNTEFMAKFMGKNSKLMAETAVQAAKLGIEMSDISSMMDSILDIETSIEKEMQVSVLLGRQISFDKARQLAMAGKTKEATREILAQVGGIAEFEKMSVIQRQALAAAAGVDLATMQSMVGNRQKQVEMGLVEASTWDGIAESVVGIGTTIGNNMGLVASFTNMVASLGGQKLGIYLAEKARNAWEWIRGKRAHKERMRQIKAEAKAKKGGSSTKGDSGKGGVLGVVEKGKAIINDPVGEATAAGEEFVTDKISSKLDPQNMEETLENGAPGEGGIKEKMQDLAEGLREMGQGTFKGILAMALTGPALVLALPAIPFLLFMGVAPLKQLGANMGSLAAGLVAFGQQAGKVLKGALVLGAVGIVLGGSFALALMMIKDVDPVQMIAFAGSIAILGLTLAVMGMVAGNVIMGALALGIVALALIPAAFAFSLLADVDIGKMIAFSLMLPLLALAAAGLGFIAPLIIAGSMALGILGLAMIPAAIAFQMLGDADMEGISKSFQDLGSQAAALLSVGPALVLMSAGLVSLAYGLLIMTPVLPTLMLMPAPLSMLAATMAVLTPLAGGIAILGPAFASMALGIAALAGSLLLLTPMLPTLLLLGGLALGVGAIVGGTMGGQGGGEESSSEGLNIIAEKLDTLIELMSQGGDINMDGKKVGEVIALARGPMGT